jgi:hypothetical protein
MLLDFSRMELYRRAHHDHWLARRRLQVDCLLVLLEHYLLHFNYLLYIVNRALKSKRFLNLFRALFLQMGLLDSGFIGFRIQM